MSIEPYAVISTTRHADRAAEFREASRAITIGKAYVQQQKIKGFFVEQGEPASRFGAGCGVALRVEQQSEAFSNFDFVVNNQNQAFRHELLSVQPGFEPERCSFALR